MSSGSNSEVDECYEIVIMDEFCRKICCEGVVLLNFKTEFRWSGEDLPPSQVIMSEFAEKYYGITKGFPFRIGSVERETGGRVGKRANIIK